MALRRGVRVYAILDFPQRWIRMRPAKPMDSVRPTRRNTIRPKSECGRVKVHCNALLGALTRAHRFAAAIMSGPRPPEGDHGAGHRSPEAGIALPRRASLSRGGHRSPEGGHEAAEPTTSRPLPLPSIGSDLGAQGERPRVVTSLRRSASGMASPTRAATSGVTSSPRARPRLLEARPRLLEARPRG